MSSTAEIVRVRWLGHKDYQSVWQEMKKFSNERNATTLDEVWLVEHPPVFTQGQNGRAEHILNPGDIPIVITDRGGQVTYHGPGQLMIYVLVDLIRKKTNVRELVTNLEQSIIDFLHEYNIHAYSKREAPGVYIDDEKICSIGLRIRHGCSYHGLAFNVAMDMHPFTLINPCGFTELKMTQFIDHGGLSDIKQTGDKLINYLMKNLGYTTSQYICD